MGDPRADVRILKKSFPEKIQELVLLLLIFISIAPSRAAL
jgi:hypothetical protein